MKRWPSTIRAATGADLAAISELLAAAALPTADLGSTTTLDFWVIDDGPRPVAAIGLERHGSAGLLRSLVVAPEHRGRGLGRALVAALEQAAREAGVDVLVLLTTTAEPFFSGLGYRVMDRSLAPDAIRTSHEFRTLCPASAACMHKSISNPDNGA